MFQQKLEETNAITEVDTNQTVLQLLFESFDKGSLKLPSQNISFSDIPWSKHPTFEGVEFKHIVTSNDTQGQFSYHLVRIAPDKSIKNHIHETQLETHEIIAGSGVCINDGVAIPYEPGSISILPAGVNLTILRKHRSKWLWSQNPAAYPKSISLTALHPHPLFLFHTT